MKLLVIGGTSFVGRGITEAALAGGHEVTLFNRGQTAPGEFSDVERLTGDRNGDLEALQGHRSWDATVDVNAYVPRQVRSLLTTLGDRAGHYTFISTVSVYADEQQPGYDEMAPQQQAAFDDDLTMAKYGALKVGCEQVARELAGDRLFAVRPGYVVGPHDPTHRFTYWIERVADGRSPMAAPALDQPLQVVDARDLGAFTVSGTARGATGPVHVIGPEHPVTFGEVLSTIAGVAGVELPELRPVRDDRLPLTMDPSDYPLETANPARSVELGMTWRPLADTIRDTLAWVRAARADGTYQPRPGVGLSAEEEQAVLAERAADGDPAAPAAARDRGAG
jgi:2'-hydroxyisoflavone reductase